TSRSFAPWWAPRPASTSGSGRTRGARRSPRSRRVSCRPGLELSAVTAQRKGPYIREPSRDDSVTPEPSQTPARPFGPPPVPPEAGGASGAVLWHTLRKHWTPAVMTALAVVLGVTFYTLGQTKIYQAAATVQFDPNPPRPLGQKVETVVEMGA